MSRIAGSSAVIFLRLRAIALALRGPPLQLLIFYLVLNAPGAHGSRKFFQQRNGLFPSNAGIGNALAIDEFFPGQEILTSGFQMTLDHDSNDPLVSACNLAGDFVADLDLTRVVLLTVGVAQIDHDSLGQACGS